MRRCKGFGGFLQKRIEAEPGPGRDQRGLIVNRQGRFGYQVAFVQHGEHRYLLRAKLLHQLFGDRDLFVRFPGGDVADVPKQVCAGGFLQCRFECFHQMMRQPPHQSHRIDQHNGPAIRQGQCPRSGVQRCEQLVLGEHACIGQRIEQRTFPHIGITYDRHSGHTVLFAAAAQQSATLFQLCKLFLQCGNPAPDMPSVGLELAFARAAGADPAAQPGKHAAKPSQAWELVSELRQLDL